jgi:2-polyprenyl-3-methyl-5-hydroxy-6-metoxy-1,4-benzoquinol methylase
MRDYLREWALRSEELLDDPRADAAVVVASLRDIARINRLFGGAAAAAARIDEFLGTVPAGSTVSLLDVGTGSGDIPRAAAVVAARRGVTLRVIGLERILAAAREAERGGNAAVLVGDGGRLPFAARSVDLVLCAKVLHHLPGAAGNQLLREMDRVARLGVVVADIRRSAVAAAGIWLASFPMQLHPVTRRDGVISVFRGFKGSELEGICADAGIAARVKRHPGWCLTAAWQPKATTA